MIRFVWQKLLHKKWLNICTLMGIILLLGVVSGTVLYQGAALNNLLMNRFDTYIGEENAYPARVEAEYPLVYEDRSLPVTEQAKAHFKSLQLLVAEKMGLEETESVFFLSSDSLYARPQYQDDASKQDYFFMPGYLKYMEEHITFLRGESFEDGADEQGIYECIINEKLVFDANLSVGEVISFPRTEMSGGKELQIRIAGIFREKDVNDSFWVKYPYEYEKILFVSENTLNEIMAGRSEQSINMNLYGALLLDYKRMTDKQADAVKAGMEEVITHPPVVKMTLTSDLPEILGAHYSARSQVKAMMQTMQIPLLALLLAFLYMVASHIFEMEQGEIAMLKSRGVSNGQVVGIYLLQSVFMTLTGTVLGLPLGYLFASLLGSANAFMEFVSRKSLVFVPDGQLVISLLLAGTLAVLFMTLPVLRYTTSSIVEVKQKKNENTKAFWQRYYLDVMILAAALYIRYNLSRQKEMLAQQIARGESMDPILFLSSVLFILGCGMVFLRLLQLLIRLIYKLCRRSLSPAAYVSFLQIIRTGKKQNFISLFLILTIAMGIFYANTARTMNAGTQERIRYDIGAQTVSREQWTSNLPTAKRNKTLVSYEEPDYLRYEALSKEQFTRVIHEDNVKIYYGNQTFEGNQLMGIHTREFGEVAWMKDGVLDKHWYHYLNEIAKVPDGVLVSSNFASATGAGVGSSIKYVLYDELMNARAIQTATICGIVDVWPGYAPYAEQVQADGSISYQDSYLIVANYGQVVSTFGLTPYEVWYRQAFSAEELRALAGEKDMELLSVQSVKDELIRSKNDASVQVTNGLLTISFLVILILCMTGFLIHWILTIKKRELMLGIYRAMGMKMKEVRIMLIHEQIFSSLTAILAGAGVGFLASQLYIPLLMIVYLPKKHALSFEVTSTVTDMARIGGALFVMLFVCFGVLAAVVSKMKIAQALKLGED